MGDGTRICFWHDRRVGVDPLKILYPELYVISANKEACIFDVVNHQEGDDVRFWNLRFYRDFKDWELAASFSLLDFYSSSSSTWSRQ